MNTSIRLQFEWSLKGKTTPAARAQTSLLAFNRKRQKVKKYCDYQLVNMNFILKNSFKKWENSFICSVKLLLIVTIQNFQYSKTMYMSGHFEAVNNTKK